MAQELRRGGYKPPILMLTSISKVTGLEYGKDKEMVPVDAFLEKPVSAATLAAKVAELLAKSSCAKEG
jgi:DNA-binding response OmpR family regulator